MLAVGGDEACTQQTVVRTVDGQQQHAAAAPSRGVQQQGLIRGILAQHCEQYNTASSTTL